jgi:plasmid replication initiation protein
MPSGKTERKVTGGKGDTEAKARKNAERAVMDADRITCCNHCKQPLIEIDNGGERLKGCLTCNLWSTVDRKLWKRLSEEDLRALYALVRDHYLIRMPRHEKRAADRSRRTEVALKTCS